MQYKRILRHSILGDLEEKNKIRIEFDGREIEAFEGEPIAAALTAAGVKVFHRSPKKNEPRGYYCAIGACSDCFMIVNGQPNVRTCVTTVEEGMTVETQIGKAGWKGLR
jgi:predicted molibdopterin-dependent oxidoreductase YjgC